jgi:organic hydroperoxide reductase OsmC/OhrA/uncharacterized protein YndB with AHSA1/START domain
MSKQYHYEATITWTGNKGVGTKDYKAYDRNHTISIEGKPDIIASADTPFRGDKTKHNPEDFLLTSLSSCHMLWYLHLCADNGITVVDYTDKPSGTLQLTAENGGHFSEVVLRPIVRITEKSQIEKANVLHDDAHRMCFIANSCNFPIKHIPTCMAHTPLIIKNSITIHAPIAKVWDALVNPEQTKKYMFGCETVSDWKVGSPLLWKGSHEGREMVFVKGNIVSIEPEKFLAYTVIDLNNAAITDVPENYLTVTYNVTTENGQTLLTVTQGDYAAVADGERRYTETYNNGIGWTPILEGIKKLVEEA